MSTGSTPHQPATDGTGAAGTGAAGGPRRRRTSARAGSDSPSVPEAVTSEPEAVTEDLPFDETISGAQAVPPAGAEADAPVAGSEEVIALLAWRPGFGIRSALRHDVATVNVPVLGPVTLPGFAHLAWYAGVAALATLEIVEPPVAALMVVAKALSDSRHHEMLREFGEAVESGV